MIYLLLLGCATPALTRVDPPELPDVDGDGYTMAADCDDGDPAIHPDAAEVCANGVDDDCNGAIDAESEGCAWVGDWDASAADVVIPMADGGQGAAPSQWATLGTALAIPNGTHGLEFYDLATRAAIPMGTTDELEGLDQVSLVRSLDDAGTSVLTSSYDGQLSAVVSWGSLSDSLQFTPTATLHYAVGDSSCLNLGFDATGLRADGDATAARVAVPCTNQGPANGPGAPSYVYVYSTARTGELGLADADLTIAGTYWGFGTDVSASDLDDDGLDDLIVGEPDWNLEAYDETYGQGVGRVFVFDGGATGAITEDDADGFIDGVRSFGYLGHNNAPVGDVDGDGYPDLAVADGRGAYVFLGPIEGEHAVDDAWGSWIPSEDHFLAVPGDTLAPAGDVDGDGGPDLLVGGPGWNGGTWLVYDLGEGAHSLEDGSGFFPWSGYCMAPGTDFDGDGRSDFVLGRTGAWDTVSVFYGRGR